MTIRPSRVLALASLMLAPALLFAQGTDSPAPPDDPNSAMPTLQDLYNRLTTGADYDLRTTFVEPSSGPGATGHTLQQVMDQAPEADDADGAVASEVLTGRRFWSLRTGDHWGFQTGTASPAPVGKTGQTTCHDGSGTEISCTGTGQDGEFQKGVAWPNPRFTANVDLNDDGDCTDDGETCDGTVTDNLTGLIWLRNANCNGGMTWAAALTWANGLYDGCTDCGGTNNDCGLGDGSSAGQWRLPNIRELESLVDFSYVDPPLANAEGTAKWSEGDAFFGAAFIMAWSSTSYAGFHHNAWSVSFSEATRLRWGNTSTWHAWPVRDAQ